MLERTEVSLSPPIAAASHALGDLAREAVRISDLAREALRRSESRYRRLFETAQDGILLLNADTAQIEDVNPYLIEMLGYSHEEFLGKKLWEVGPFADIAQTKQMFVELQAEGYVRYEGLPLKTKAGRHIQVEFVCNSYDCEGVKVIQCDIRDISERKLLERSRAEFSKIVESSNEAIFTKDLQGIITSWNRAASALYGISAGEAIGQSIGVIAPRARIKEYGWLIDRVVSGQTISQFRDRPIVQGRQPHQRLVVTFTGHVGERGSSWSSRLLPTTSVSARGPMRQCSPRQNSFKPWWSNQSPVSTLFRTKSSSISIRMARRSWGTSRSLN